MSGDVRGYFSSFLLLLLCFNTSASSRSHRKLLLGAAKTDFRVKPGLTLQNFTDTIEHCDFYEDFSFEAKK